MFSICCQDTSLKFWFAGPLRSSCVTKRPLGNFGPRLELTTSMPSAWVTTHPRSGVPFSLERLIELLDCLGPVLLRERFLTLCVVLVPGIGSTRPNQQHRENDDEETETAVPRGQGECRPVCHKQ